MRGVSVASVSFSGHETFPFRYGWLPKAVRFVGSDPRIFAREDALVELGVGKNMVRSIRHWGLACGVLEEDPAVRDNRGKALRVSDLGEFLLAIKGGVDPYLEDPASLWLLHWQLSSTPDYATTWFWVFNHCPQPEFSKDDLVLWLSSLAERSGAGRVSEASLRRDIDCFLGTYVTSVPNRAMTAEDTLECPLVELELLREFGRGSYILQRGDHPGLPDELFVFALVSFLERIGTTAQTVAVDEIAFAPGSPGRVFALTEDNLLGRLERLAKITGGNLDFDETAGLRQVITRRPVDKLKLLQSYYQRSMKGLNS
jgi:hypothetical protein